MGIFTRTNNLTSWGFTNLFPKIAEATVIIADGGTSSRFEARTTGDFTYGNFGTISGIIETYQVEQDGLVILRAYGLDVDVHDFWAKATADGLWALDVLTSGDDSVTMTNLSDNAYTGAGNDFAQGFAGDDYIDGGLGDDELRGGKGDDLIYGKEGQDLLFGGRGDDSVGGGNDADIIHGNAGHDNLAGDLGDDFFVRKLWPRHYSRRRW